MFASSVRPESETILEVAVGVMPSPLTCAAKAQTLSAAINCRSATRLVAR